MNQDLTVTCRGVGNIFPDIHTSMFPLLSVQLELVDLKDLCSQIDVEYFIDLVGVEDILSAIDVDEIQKFLKEGGY